MAAPALPPEPAPGAPREGSGPLLEVRGGELCMEGVSLPRLAARLGPPFFLLSERRLAANYRALERGLAAAGIDLEEVNLGGGIPSPSVLDDLAGPMEALPAPDG